MAQLPEIKLTCRNDHTFTTRARNGTSISCPVCRPARVSVWVPRDRPRTEREARQRAERDGQADTPAAGSELADRWEREAPWDGEQLPDWPGRPDDRCPECGGPLTWEPGRTWTHCETCAEADGGVALPAAVAEHYRRQDQRSAEVAVKTGPGVVDRVTARRAQVRLDARKQRMADQVNELAEAFDPDGLYGGPKHLALDYRAGLNAYLRQIGKADSEDELAEIEAEVKEIIIQAETSGALTVIQQQRTAIERQQEQARREAEQAEREAREAARQAQIEAQAQRKAIEGRAAHSPIGASQSGYAAAMQSVALMYGAYEKRRKNKDQKLSEYGPCQYPHRSPTVPDRRYWITTLDWQGNPTWYELPGAPSVVTCNKHSRSADEWLNEQAGSIMSQQRVAVTFTELK